MNIFSKQDSPSQLEKAAVKNNKISFPNKREALLLFPSSTDSAGDIITTLHLKSYKAVFLNLGNSDNFGEALLPSLLQLFSRGIAVAAIDAGALIIDGGLTSGVMDLMGKGIADRGYKSILIGITSSDKITFQGDAEFNESLEANHSHFILTEGGNWRTDPVVNEVISRLIRRPGKFEKKIIERKVPALAIVTGGNESTKELLLQAVRLKFTVIIVEGSGGLADDVAAAMQVKDTLPKDPAMAEIIFDGKLFFHELTKPATDIHSLISSSLGDDKVLMQAWETFADYDLNANKQQGRFDKLQQSIILTGTIGTALAIIQEVIKSVKEPSATLSGFAASLYVVLIIIPITLTILVTIANRFKQGNKWLLLRAAAESIKREIFRYRTRTNDYVTNPEQQLTKKVEDITRRTMRTEVNSSYIIPYNKELGLPPDMYGSQRNDDGFSKLDPGQYIDLRLGDQLNYFKTKSVRLGKQLTIFSIAIFIVGGIGTFLAAIHLPVWIALTTTIIAALSTYLGYRQTENTLTKYNQTGTNLANIKGWWNALSFQDQQLQDNISTLVEQTEQVLQVEMDGWIQQMQNALAELRKNQETKPEVNENKEPVEKLKDPKDTVKENAKDQPVAEVPVTGENTDGLVVAASDPKETAPAVGLITASGEDDQIPVEPSPDKKEILTDVKADLNGIIDEPAKTPGADTTIDIDKGNTNEGDKIAGKGSTYVQPPSGNMENSVMDESGAKQVAIPFVDDKK